MKHVYRFLTAFIVAALIWGVGGQKTGLEGIEILGLTGVAFVLAALILYFDSLLPGLNAQRILGLSFGILGGLIAGYLLQQLFISMGGTAKAFSLLLYLLPVLFFGYVGLFASWPAGSRGALSAAQANDKTRQSHSKLLDTSVIIDGRIMDIAETKFVEGPFIVPNYVLREIQLISDSSDAIKRNRGRRGLDMLNKLQAREDIEVKISYKDYSDIREVDAKLIRMAIETNAYLVTNDFNLNKVAELQGIEVLNLNSLTNALKPVVLPGEDMQIDILREGKDENQGIGYMEDGTMVVVENGGPLLGKKVLVNVTSIIQTAAGKMIFTRAQNVIEDSPNHQGGNAHGHSGNGRRGRGRSSHGERRSSQRSRR